MNIIEETIINKDIVSYKNYLEYKNPPYIEHPIYRDLLIAANLLEYHASKNRIPLYSGIIDALRRDANFIKSVACGVNNEQLS